MDGHLTIPEFMNRVKLHNTRQERWSAEKEALSREISILLGQKAAIDLVRMEFQERIYAFQRTLGLPLDIALPPRPIAPPIDTPEIDLPPLAFQSPPAPDTTSSDASTIASESSAPPSPSESASKRLGKRSIRKRGPAKVVVVSASAYDYKPKHEITVHLDCVRALCFYESHPIIVSGSDDGTIRVTNLEAKCTVARKVVRRVVNIASLRAHGGPVLYLAGFEREQEQMMLSSGTDGVICLWALPAPGGNLYETHGILTHHRVAEIKLHKEAVWSVDILDDLRTGVSADGSGIVKMWQIDAGEGFDLPVHDFGVSVKALTGKKFVVGCKSGNVRLFDGPKQISVIAAGAAPILKVAVGGEPGQVLAVCDDNLVRVLDTQEGTVTNEVDGHDGGLTSLCLTPDNEFLITIGNDASVNVWRTGEFLRIDNVKLHSTKFGEGALCCAAASAKCGKVCFATGGAEGTVHVFVKG
jgi:WD40 repeat protein